MLKNKISVVTGAARGIGKEVSKIFAREESTVLLFDIDKETLNKTAEELSCQSGDIYTFKIDVCNSLDVNNVIGGIIDRFKKIDILVNSAGIFETTKLLNTSDELFNKVLDVNLKGVFYCCRAVAKKMIENKYGKIVNISSLAGKTRPITAGHSYSTSKAGIIGLTRSIASELAEHNINVNAIAPSLVETDLVGILTKEKKEEIMSNIPLKRITTVEDIANLILFMVSDLSKNITGEIININGGVFMD